jgi:hypothetical protein
MNNAKLALGSLCLSLIALSSESCKNTEKQIVVYNTGKKQIVRHSTKDDPIFNKHQMHRTILSMSLHPQLPRIVALDTFISYTHRRR